MKSHISEIVLGLVLVMLVACMRLYYGGNEGVMLVWKGECNFKDTLVNLDEMMKLPKQELAQDHHSVLWQLEEMGMLDEEGKAVPVKHPKPAPDAPKIHRQTPVNSGFVPKAEIPL